MRILVCRTGDVCMRRMRNLCEMYAKCMRSQQDKCSNGFYSVFGAFSEVSSFANFLYAKYAKVIFGIYASTLPTSFRFAYSHTFSISILRACFVIWSVLVCASMRRFQISHTFAYFA